MMSSDSLKMEDKNEQNASVNNVSVKPERLETEVKEVIEVNLDVNNRESEMFGEFEIPMSESDIYVKDEVSEILNEQPTIVIPKNEETIAFQDNFNDEFEFNEVSSIPSEQNFENIYSSKTKVQFKKTSECSLNKEPMFLQNSMINALFNKSPVAHDKSESSEIQVTIFLPNNQSITKHYPANININELKRDLGENIGEEPDRLLISLMGDSAGIYLGDWTPLLGIPPNAVGGLILNLSYKYDIELINTIELPSIETYTPIITVRQVEVEDSVGRTKYVTVVTEDISYTKEWLGGYKNKKTGQMYHNASTTTRYWDKKPKFGQTVDMNSRDAQTHLPYINRFTQVSANKTTQMWRPDHYIQSVGDVVITAKPYLEYDLQSQQQERLASAIKIQRWYRKMVSKHNVRKAFLLFIDLIRKQRESRYTAGKAMDASQLNLFIDIAHPTTKDSFYQLYSTVSKWWRLEYNKIQNIKNISERKSALYNLLQEEVSLLFAIDKQRIKSKNEAMQRRSLKVIHDTSRPIIRHQRKGNMTIVDTLEIQRARELKEVYTTYIRDDLDNKDRIQTLLSICDVVSTFDEIDRSQDLLTLLNREIDMITMGISKKCLKGLRKRIEEGLLHMIRDPEFNPQVQLLRPISCSRLKQRTYLCKGCLKLKPASDFPLHVNLVNYRECKSCLWLRITTHNVLNMAPYTNILQFLRAREIAKCPRSSYCFLIQSLGTYTIVNNIWEGKSALSEAGHLPSLRLCRWDNKIEWSPWNTLLLTDEEVEVHERIENIDDVYEEEFIQYVQIKHIQAKFYFKVMYESDKYFRESGLYDSAIDENLYQHAHHRQECEQSSSPIFNSPPNKAIEPKKLKKIL